jgi:enamine deaminase RidA (YjgF/YER057c/UK114 family)
VKERQLISTGNPWERSICFSRAVRIGSLVFTAGTIAADEQGVIHGDTCYEQACYILDKLTGVLAQAGSGLRDVVRVVCYLVDLADAEGFTKAHAQYFAGVFPAATCVQVCGLFGNGTKIELELTAVVHE